MDNRAGAGMTISCIINSNPKLQAQITLNIYRHKKHITQKTPTTTKYQRMYRLVLHGLISTIPLNPVNNIVYSPLLVSSKKN